MLIQIVLIAVSCEKFKRNSKELPANPIQRVESTQNHKKPQNHKTQGVSEMRAGDLRPIRDRS